MPRDSAAYREFARLYWLARSIRPTGVERWSGDLYATDAETCGGFNNRTGSIMVSGPLVLQYLTGSVAADRRSQSQALATVLHEATHAGMEMDARAEPNAVRTIHSLGLTEGVAELRAAADLQIFTELAGYPGLVFSEPQYEGAFAATESLLSQASGLRVDSQALIDQLVQGPGVMHFDQLADGVLRNRLAEVVPFRVEDRAAVRAALISTMLHPHWAILTHRPTEVGELVASEIGRALNAKVDEIRRHYQSASRELLPVAPPNAEAAPANLPTPAGLQPGPVRAQWGRTTERGEQPPDREGGRQVPSELRFLSGLAPAAEAPRNRPSSGNGSRGAGPPSGTGFVRPPSTRAGPPDRGRA